MDFPKEYVAHSQPEALNPNKQLKKNATSFRNLFSPVVLTRSSPFSKMTTIRRLNCDDLFRFNNINLDVYTETFTMSFYLHYMMRWPQYNQVHEAPNGDLMGYAIGKAEGEKKIWHGHVSAVTVAPEFRRIGLARQLMKQLENTSVEQYNAFFVDLFVRSTNSVAINMYKRMGYCIYRTVLGYYSECAGWPEENAYDMRKPLPRDEKKESVAPLERPEIQPSELDHN